MKTGWYGTARGRVGLSSGPGLFYITGGFAIVDVRNRFVIESLGIVDSRSNSELATGWTIGGGIEAALGHNWTAKTEYLYIDAGSQEVFNPTYGAGDGGTARFDNRFHVFRFGLNRRFASGDAAAVIR